MDASKKLNITEYCLKSKAKQAPDKTALIVADSVDSVRRFSYLELYKQTARLSAGLKSIHLPKGSVVAIQAEDAYDLLLSFLAAIAADLVPVTLLMSLVANGVSYILNHSKARLFLQLNTKDYGIPLPSGCLKVGIKEYSRLKEFPFENTQSTTLFNDPAFIFYTSGSAGHPKGVLHAQRAILGREPSLKYWLDLKENDVVLQTDNLCWTYSMFTGFLDPLSVGATALVYNPSNVSSLAENEITGQTWLQLIERYHVSVLASTPDTLYAILNEKNIHRYNTSSLRIAGSAGTLLSDTIQKQWQDRFGYPIYTALGMTEISTFISTGPLIPPRPPSIGKIQPGRKVALLPMDEGTAMLAVHKDELGLMLGYLGESAHDKVDYQGDWFLTKDIMTMDKDGYLTYLGRIDSILKVGGGFRVSTIQVENVIKMCPQVKDAACGAIFDKKTQTDRLVAYVVSEEPKVASGEAIYQYLSKHLSDYKIPKALFFVSEIPYTARGKIDRGKLNELKPLFIYTRINHSS